MDAILTAPHATSDDTISSRIALRFRRGIRAVQYSRMIQAMSELSDDQLASLDLTRADIPRHAWKCVSDTRV